MISISIGVDVDGDSGNCVGVGCEDPVLNFLVGGPLAPDEEEVDEEGESLLFGSQSSSLGRNSWTIGSGTPVHN